MDISTQAEAYQIKPQPTAQQTAAWQQWVNSRLPGQHVDWGGGRMVVTHSHRQLEFGLAVLIVFFSILGLSDTRTRDYRLMYVDYYFGYIPNAMGMGS